MTKKSHFINSNAQKCYENQLFWVKNKKSFDFSFGYGKILIPLHPQNVQNHYICMYLQSL